MLALREEAAEENNLYSNCIQYLHHQETRKLELKHFDRKYSLQPSVVGQEVLK